MICKGPAVARILWLTTRGSGIGTKGGSGSRPRVEPAGVPAGEELRVNDKAARTSWQGNVAKPRSSIN